MQYFLLIVSIILMVFSLIVYTSGFFMKNVKEDKRNKRRYVGIGIFVIALILLMIGDNLKISMMKNEVVKYYEKNIPYEEMSNVQKQNITSIFSLEEIPKDKRDKYIPAFKYYIKEYYKFLNQEDKIDEGIKIFIDEKINLEDK